MLCGRCLSTHLVPAGAIEPGGALDQLLSLGRILLPPLVIRHRAPITQQTGIPEGQRLSACGYPVPSDRGGSKHSFLAGVGGASRVLHRKTLMG